MPNDTHDDIRRLLFEATADLPGLAPAPEQTLRRARRRMAVTFSTIAVVVGLAIGGIVTAAGPFTKSVPANEDPERGGTWIVDTDTGVATRLAGVPRQAFWFDASSDGSTIAFAAQWHGTSQIYVMARDGSGRHVVTHDRYEASQPAFSPDGSMLAYQGFGSQDHRNVFIEDLATGRVRQLTYERHDPSELSWSPDGERILYSMSIHGDPSASVFDNGASSVLKIVDVGSGRVQKLAGTHRSAADFGTWSPDGEQIAFMTGQEWTDNAYGFNPAEIWVMDADGSNARRLTSLDARAFGLAWTPDGNLSFSQEDGDAFTSYEIDLQTRQVSTITNGVMPVWLDDHTVIVSR